MSRLVLLLLVAWLSIAAAQLGLINSWSKGIKKGVTKEMQSLSDPVEKTVMYIGFSQCKHVKRLLGVDYDSYNNTEPDLSDLTLNFMTRAVNVSYKLTMAAGLIPQSPWFSPRHPLKIYLHGFTDNPTKSSFGKLSVSFLNQGDFNLLALDASSLIRWFYLRSTTMVRFIGQELGKILAALVKVGVQPSSIHLIGHSLGSHISGFAGKTFQSLTGQRVGRISGLDPAGPCFSDVNVTLRLGVNDADFVDVIHTDAGFYGLDEKVGHVDFYPNSGSQQPNCLPNLLLASCSHSRAWELFAESVTNPAAFVGVNCASWQDFKDGKCNNNNKAIMGYACQPGTVGLYYLHTSDEPPYGLGMDGAKYINKGGFFKKLGNTLAIKGRSWLG